MDTIRNKTNPIPIYKNIKKFNEVTEYSLKENLFDPFRNSPPNDFIIKLKKRINIYNKDINPITK
jgi:hypothetical protein